MLPYCPCILQNLHSYTIVESFKFLSTKMPLFLGIMRQKSRNVFTCVMILMNKFCSFFVEIIFIDC